MAKSDAPFWAERQLESDRVKGKYCPVIVSRPKLRPALPRTAFDAGLLPSHHRYRQETGMHNNR
jgi:hypothetical protein